MAIKRTYADTTTQMRSVVGEFDLLSPKEVPLLKLISGGSEEEPSLNSLSEPCRNSKFEWLEDADPPVRTLLLANITDSATTLTVTAEDAPYITEGDILLIGTEQFWVSASDGANNITVTGGWGSTTRAAHTADDTVYVIGRAHKEGGDAPTDSYTYPTLPYNLIQEITATIHLSELEQLEARYGIDSAVEYETAKKSRRNYIMLERQCFYGKRVVGTASIPATFGGLKTFITESGHIKDLGGGTLGVDDIEDIMQACYTDVGMVGVPDTILCGAWVRRKISSIYSSVGVTVYRDQTVRRGGVIVDVVDTHFGPVDLVLTPWCDPTDLFLVKKDKLGIGPKDGAEMHREMLAKTGTADKWIVSGAYTFQVRASKSHGYIAGISTAA